VYIGSSLSLDQPYLASGELIFSLYRNPSLDSNDHQAASIMSCAITRSRLFNAQYSRPCPASTFRNCALNAYIAFYQYRVVVQKCLTLLIDWKNAERSSSSQASSPSLSMHIHYMRLRLWRPIVSREALLAVSIIPWFPASALDMRLMYDLQRFSRSSAFRYVESDISRTRCLVSMIFGTSQETSSSFREDQRSLTSLSDVPKAW
jgi:hypothetical protein